MAGYDNDRDVLIVDDDEVMCELLIALMSVEGYSVSHAASAEDALRRVREGATPGVILCDVHMPGMRGGELAAALAAARDSGSLPANTLLVGMSASEPRGGEAKNFDAFLGKPFGVDDFTRLVREARARGRQHAVAGNAAFSAESHGDGANRASGRPPLDERTFSQLRSKLGDASMRELYQMTLDDVRERLGRMAAAAASGDSVTVQREAHTIKGSCGMVGASELQELAAATEGGSPVDNSALANFDSACQRLRRMLDEKL